MIADGKLCHLAADGCDRADRLVAHFAPGADLYGLPVAVLRDAERLLAEKDRQVGVAEADRFRFDQNIVFAQFGQLFFHELKMLGSGDIRG